MVKVGVGYTEAKMDFFEVAYLGAPSYFSKSFVNQGNKNDIKKIRNSEIATRFIAKLLKTQMEVFFQNNASGYNFLE